MTELDLDLYGDLDNIKWERDIREVYIWICGILKVFIIKKLNKN